MITYITAFIFYTLAMIGIMLVGFVVYKKFILNNKTTNKNMIKILDSVSVAPKKNLLVVRVKNEKFLIASDAERTTFLAKLAEDNQQKKEPKNQEKQDKRKQKEPEEKQPEISAKDAYEQVLKMHETQSLEEVIRQKMQQAVAQQLQPQQTQQTQVRDLQQERLNKIHKQFQNLYSSDEGTQNVPNRKEMVKKLLKELNDATNTKASGY